MVCSHGIGGDAKISSPGNTGGRPYNGLSDSDSRLVRAFRDTDGTKGECGHNHAFNQVGGQTP